MTDELLIERSGDLTRLTMNRPEKANALNAPLVESLLKAVETAQEDGTRLLVFDGNGPSFSGGFDFTGIKEQSDADLVFRLIRIETLLQCVYHAPFVTVALAHGRVFGAGADLVCACSRRISAPGTMFRMPGLGFGVVLGTRRLVHRIGADAARAILQETRAFDAEEARRLNFLHEIVDRSDWPDVLAEASTAAQILDPSASATLFNVAVADSRDADMASLVRSVTRPGLKRRMLSYLATVKR